jgi:hypothetical protein
MTELSIEKINNLSADEEMDRLIVEHVFNSQVKENSFGDQFSEGVSMAWWIVKHLLKEGFDFEIRSVSVPSKTGTVDGFSCKFFDFNDMDPVICGGVGYVTRSDETLEWCFPAFAETLPLAICRAALLLRLELSRRGKHGTIVPSRLCDNDDPKGEVLEQ